MGKSPHFLYHYTSINTLGFILKNKNMRFNSLEHMDDADEVKIWNGNFGKYCFVSCWTDEEKESIPMWKMYSNDLKGVRIKLPIFPFKVYCVGEKEYIISPEVMYQNKYYFSNAEKGKFLRPVQYESIQRLDNLKNGEVGKKSYEYFGFDEHLLGYYKSVYWEFQKEWRYILYAIPTRHQVAFGEEEKDQEYIKDLPDLPIRDKYLELANEQFKKMEITMGPKTNEIDELFVNMLIDKYNPQAKVVQSVLKGRV